MTSHKFVKYSLDGGRGGANGFRLSDISPCSDRSGSNFANNRVGLSADYRVARARQVIYAIT